MNAKTLFFYFLFFVAFTDIKADFSINDNGNCIDIINEYIYKDSTKKLTAEQICKTKTGFYKSSVETGFFTDINAVYWLRFKINNPTKQALIFYRNKDFKDIRLFYFKKNCIPIEINPFYEKSTKSFFFKKQEFVFELANADTSLSYLFRFVPVAEQFIGMNASTTHAFYAESLNDVFYYGCFFGLVILMMFYNLIHYSTVREYPNLIYSFFLFGLMCFALVVWKIISIDALSQNFSFFLYSFSYTIMTVSLVLYTYYFFESEINQSIHKKILFTIVAFKIIVLILQGTFESINRAFFSPIYDLIFIAYCLFIGILFFFKHKSNSSLFFILGFGILILGLFFHGLYDIKIFINNIFHEFFKNIYEYDNGFYIDNALFFTGVIQILFFSISMSIRYRMIKIQAIASQNQVIFELESKQQFIDNQNKILEKTVEERTAQIRNQALEIARINQLLQKQNIDLKENVSTISQNRVLVKSISFDEFKASYPTDNDCYLFLSNLKWNEGFKCKKCESETFSLIDKQFSRRCTKCNYIESATAHTIFHHLRFPIVKAFYIVFLVYSRKGITIEELSRILELRAGTCHTFKQKFTQVMEKKKVSKRNIEGWSSYVLD